MLKAILFCLLGFAISFNVDAQTLSPQKSGYHCLPSQPCWPNKKTWTLLANQLDGRLIKPVSPIVACLKNKKSNRCQETLKNLKNPFFLQEKPGDTESQGWLNAWQAKLSVYAVEAKTTDDVVAAVNFARKHRLRLVIKGAGHDYLGRSTAPNSLLIWTHNMRKITYHPNFVPAGCHTPGMNAITVGAGVRWLEAYTAATTQHHEYVQGGGCSTVGAAGGFTQGGGFGSFSKKFGTGAAGVLQIEVVTADGKVHTINQCQNPDLFWALRGGGGGTFGVVTKMTLQTHPLPKFFGVLRGTIQAKNDVTYKKLIQYFLQFFRMHINNSHWGEQFSLNPDNSIRLFLLSQGLNKKQVKQVWQPLKKWVQKTQGAVTFTSHYFSIPPNKMWNLHYWEKNHPKFVVANTRKNARPGEFWWAPNSGEVYNYWYTYQSWWFPKKLLSPLKISHTIDVLFKASRLGSVSFHINKGLADAANDALKRTKKTSTNPKVYDAAALIIMAAGSNKEIGKPKVTKAIKEKIDRINKVMQRIKNLAPNAGTYANEADYFEKNWQQAFWGVNYSKLLRIKKQYDPSGLFTCHHCVGSE